MAGEADTGGIDRDREGLVRVLTRHRVAFVLIGGEDVHESKRRADRPKDREYLRAIERGA